VEIAKRERAHLDIESNVCEVQSREQWPRVASCFDVSSENFRKMGCGQSPGL